MRSLILFPYLIAGVIPFWLGACSPAPPQSTQKSTPSSPETVLRISVQPTQDRVEQERMIAPLEAHLEQVLGQQVDFILAQDYQESVDMVVDGRANAVYAGVVSYFEAVERGAKVKPLVAPIDADTVRPWYRSCFVVTANSSIKTLRNLKGKRVGFVDPSSTSGYLVPLAALQREGINPEQDFSQVVFGGTHEGTGELLATHQVDAIATNLATYNQLREEGKGKNLRIIWESDPIPHAPILVSQNLPPDLIQKLKKAFLTAPEGIKDLMGAKTIGYTLVEDEDYESIEELRRQVNLSGGSSQ
ncbi:phosphate/phosphite/phosphonate ABC transporter substrate-binding protein [Calothrix sp. NIES-3974]|uniref:phosphate/phosphite/phosphonate ABC transporter substrate-binding protein n=1 Tax=Calothrix sp. NIES-3974 TaxID=2005462 RepID=UPI000B5FCBD7|nr:phosphate/phosphite/phosphonate ABC transporter substrate-binding protein [Calothrix sp. NIES-3974]BAZ07828.1 phosphonate-binding periplasmic protein [Calothrix sp. NIES-3974]